MSTERQIFEALVTKLANSSYVTDTNNIIIGESLDHSQLNESFFPRLEVLAIKSKEDDYIDQRQISQEFRFSVCGWVRRDRFNNLITKDDMYYLMDFLDDTRKLIKSFNTDRINGIFVCDGFEKVSGYGESFYDFEIIEKLDSFTLIQAIEFTVADGG